VGPIELSKAAGLQIRSPTCCPGPASAAPRAELLIKSKAQTGGVAAIKGAVTCPDCKRIIAQYAL
jgi:hypothetical protein